MQIRSLKKKLEELGQYSNIPGKQASQLKLSDKNVADLLDGHVIENEWGKCIVRQKSFPKEFRHAEPIHQYLTLQGHDFKLIAKDPTLANADPQTFYFLDTETTGLAGGAGTYVFLIGIGKFSDKSFVIKQYFMIDYGSESAFLQEAKKELVGGKGIVTFNGKSYDIPVLKNRFILNQIQHPFQDILHVDLLHVSRRLWKKSIGTCTLQNIEQQKLGFRRDGDIPGSEIPTLYFNYLTNNDLAPLKKVLQHNVMDILSLVSIFIKASRAFRKDDLMNSDDYDALSVVKTFESLGLYEKAGVLCRHLADENPDSIATDFMLRQAQNFKKLGRWQEAVKVWQEVCDRGRFHPLPYIELAKVYEHRKKDYLAALTYVDRALKSLRVLSELGAEKYSDYHTDLVHRQKRLKRKMIRHRNGANANKKIIL